MTSCSSRHPERVYRVERFKVPDAALKGFLEAAARSHEILRRLPGFVKGSVFERTGGPSGTYVVTVAVWESPQAAKTATALVGGRHHKVA